jgi:hypothetical protein
VKAGSPIPPDIRDLIRRDWLLGETTNEELARKYNVHPNSILNLARRENWEELKELFTLQKQLVALGERLIATVRQRLRDDAQVSSPSSPSSPPAREAAERGDDDGVEDDLSTEEPPSPDQDDLNWSF